MERYISKYKMEEKQESKKIGKYTIVIYMGQITPVGREIKIDVLFKNKTIRTETFVKLKSAQIAFDQVKTEKQAEELGAPVSST